MIKLIVTDFDGTLRPYGTPDISRGLRERIGKALDSGVAVAVSSGRTYLELRSFLPEFADRLYFICCDGAYCVKDGRVIYKRPIECSDLAFFFGKISDGISFVLHGADRNYGVGNLPDAADIFAPEPIKRTPTDESIFKVTTYGKKIELSPFSGLRTHWDGGEYLSAQFVNRFANKGTALSDLQVRLMRSKFDTAAIGDSGNDIPMLKGAKLAFAVGSHSESLAAIATHKFSTAEEAFDLIAAENASLPKYF
jgi:HAD superfamily hydrolase (TIGR01484 family)